MHKDVHHPLTLTLEAYIVNNIIEFDCEWNGEDRIRAIKVLRAATGGGLRDSKQAVEACEDRPVHWRMTPEQFGILMGSNLDMSLSNNFYISKVRVIPIPEVTDFTNPSPF